MDDKWRHDAPVIPGIDRPLTPEECRETADGLEITTLDKGEAPDRSKICAREIGCDQPGGLGTHIIKNVMDKVSYEESPEGNRFVASKLLRKPL